jgi:hypothetical protein
MVGEMGLEFQLTTEQLCVLARRIVDYKPTDSRHRDLICRDMQSHHHLFRVKGEPELRQGRLGFYRPSRVVSVAWTSNNRKDRITAAATAEGMWNVRFEGAPLADVGNAYFTHLLMLKPELDPLQAVEIRIELGVLKMAKNPRKRRTARIMVQQILRTSKDPITALKRMEPEIQKELAPLSQTLGVKGLEALQKKLALKKAA